MLAGNLFFAAFVIAPVVLSSIKALLIAPVAMSRMSDVYTANLTRASFMRDNDTVSNEP